MLNNKYAIALYHKNEIFCWAISTNASEFIGFALSAFFSVEMDYIHIAGNCVIFRTPFRSILQKFLRNFWITSISREKKPFIFSMFDYTYLQIWTFFISRLYVKYILLQELFRQRILVFNQKCKIWIWYDMICLAKKNFPPKFFFVK